MKTFQLIVNANATLCRNKKRNNDCYHCKQTHCVHCAGKTYTDVSRPLANRKKMSAKDNVSNSPRSGNSQFAESTLRDRNAAHTPVTLYDTLSVDDTAKPTGLPFTFWRVTLMQRIHTGWPKNWVHCVWQPTSLNRMKVVLSRTQLLTLLIIQIGDSQRKTLAHLYRTTLC